MKKARYDNTPIPIPDDGKRIGDWSRFMKDVKRSLVALRDRKVMLPGGKPTASIEQPWKVTSNGDDTVSVAAGRAYHWEIGEETEGAALDNPISFTGEDSLTVAATGTSYIYAKLPVGTAQVAGGTSNRQLAGTVTVEDETDDPSAIDTSSDVYLLLATVSKADGVVTVTEQHLSHNPVVSIQDADAATGHPWKVTANGDDTVTVADGSILYFTAAGSTEVLFEPFDGNHVDYSSGDVTITASGTLYAKISLTTADSISSDSVTLVASYGVQPSSVTVALDPTLSGSEMSIPIADVTLSGGVATVDTQYLVHNPLVDLTWAEGLTP